MLEFINRISRVPTKNFYVIEEKQVCQKTKKAWPFIAGLYQYTQKAI